MPSTAEVLGTLMPVEKGGNTMTHHRGIIPSDEHAEMCSV